MVGNRFFTPTTAGSIPPAVTTLAAKLRFLWISFGSSIDTARQGFPAPVAQLVEREPEELGVAGSIPAGSTTPTLASTGYG